MMQVSKSTFIFFIILAVVLAITVTQRVFLKESKVTTTLPSSESTQAEPSNETINGYSKVPSSEIETISAHTVRYHFKSGQPNREGPDVFNNYSITFPDTWQAYTFTNDKNRDDHGTNLLLKKGENSIVISQQLLEASMCHFDKKYLSENSVGVYCQFVQDIKNTDFNLKVFMREDMPLSNGSVTYGVCDHDAYAQSIATYAEPTESDKAACSPWTKFGEITFTTTKDATQSYEEFLWIIDSLKVIE